VRSALAKGLGVDEDKITVDYDSKTANVDLADATPDMEALAKVMDETRFTAELAD